MCVFSLNPRKTPELDITTVLQIRKLISERGAVITKVTQSGGEGGRPKARPALEVKVKVHLSGFESLCIQRLAGDWPQPSEDFRTLLHLLSSLYLSHLHPI